MTRKSPFGDGENTTTIQRTAHEWADRGNELCRKHGRKDIEWVPFEGKPIVRWVRHPLVMLQDTWRTRADVMDRRGQPMTESDTFKLNTELEKLGATARYRRDGSRYLIEAS